MSATQIRSGASAWNWRSTRSGTARWLGSTRVVPVRSAPAHPGQALTRASAEPPVCGSPGIRRPSARHGPEAPRRRHQMPRGWPVSCPPTPRRASHEENAHGFATRSTRWGRRPAPGTSWPPDDGPDSPSRARGLRPDRAGLPSEPAQPSGAGIPARRVNEFSASEHLLRTV